MNTQFEYQVRLYGTWSATDWNATAIYYAG